MVGASGGGNCAAAGGGGGEKYSKYVSLHNRGVSGAAKTNRHVI
jgi:hypothetical protein